MELWEIINSGGALGLSFVVLVTLYREYHRVVAQRDKLFDLLFRTVQAGNDSVDATATLLQDKREGIL